MGKIPPSNDMKLSRGSAANKKNEISFRLKSCKFSLQMDESTNVAGPAILIVIVRYQHDNL